MVVYWVQGIIFEDKVDAFDLPLYGASLQEVKQVIEDQGSFDAEKAESLWVQLIYV